MSSIENKNQEHLVSTPMYASANGRFHLYPFTIDFPFNYIAN